MRLSLQQATLLLCILFALDTAPFAESKKVEPGFPDIRIFPSSEINTNRGSRFVSLDPDGRILFSGQGELTAYNGVSWKRISTPNIGPIDEYRVVKTRKDGTTFAAGLTFWGKLVVNSEGNYIVEDLSDTVDKTQLASEHYHEIAFHGDDVYFASFNTIVRWSPTKGNKIWKRKGLDPILFALNDRVYYFQTHVGLFAIENDETVFVEGSEILATDNTRTMTAGPWFDGRHAFLNSSKGFVLFDGATFETKETELNQLSDYLWSDDFVLATPDVIAISLDRHGIIFMDRAGQIINQIDHRVDYRLIDTGKIQIAEDGSLWTCLSEGVARIFYPHPVTFIDQRFGPSLNWYEIERHNGKLLISSDGVIYEGVYQQSGILDRLEPKTPHEPGNVTSIISTENGLLATTLEGLFLFDDEWDYQVLKETAPLHHIAKSRNDPDLYIATGIETIYVFKLVDGQYRPVEEAIPSHITTNRIQQDDEGVFWLEHGVGAVGRLEVENGKPHYKNYSADEMWPASRNTQSINTVLFDCCPNISRIHSPARS
ncbi:MAG: hypothetical protein AAGB46_18970 [Verrucomicrobiota bacterium]